MDARSLLELFVQEDLAGGDPTSDLLEREATVRARIVSRQDGIVSGVGHAAAIFGMRACAADILVRDGERVAAGQTVMAVSGRAADVLALERVALNLLSRMSGIATLTARLVSELPEGVRLLATRKTAPGLRPFDKEAVEAGGGLRHRMNLGEMIMIKDNHISVDGSADRLIRKARLAGGRFEVEADTCAAALAAAALKVPVILLDNFTPDMIRDTVGELKRRGLRDAVELEASGGINAGNVAEYGRTGVDYVSAGCVTNSAPALDLSLEV